MMFKKEKLGFRKIRNNFFETFFHFFFCIFLLENSDLSIFYIKFLFFFINFSNYLTADKEEMITRFFFYFFSEEKEFILKIDAENKKTSNSRNEKKTFDCKKIF